MRMQAWREVMSQPGWTNLCGFVFAFALSHSCDVHPWAPNHGGTSHDRFLNLNKFSGLVRSLRYWTPTNLFGDDCSCVTSVLYIITFLQQQSADKSAYLQSAKRSREEKWNLCRASQARLKGTDILADKTLSGLRTAPSDLIWWRIWCNTVLSGQWSTSVETFTATLSVHAPSSKECFEKYQEFLWWSMVSFGRFNIHIYCPLRSCEW